MSTEVATASSSKAVDAEIRRSGRKRAAPDAYSPEVLTTAAPKKRKAAKPAEA
ncbi:hypothetical protein H4S02_011508, partial [Coemansia sp. RSA 2611]